MSNLDDRLRDALRREEPPADFAARILERLPAGRPNVVHLPARGRTVPRFALAAAAALAIATASVWLAIPRGDIQPKVVDGAPSVDTKTEVPPPTIALVDSTPTPGGLRVQPASVTPRHVAPRKRAAPEPAVDPAVEAQAIRAAEQLRLALKITGDKLNVARHELRATLTVPES